MIIVKTKLLKGTILGLTLFPFILVNKEHYEGWLKNDEKRYKELINHEKIHIRQQIECLIIPFYFMYAFMYIKNRLKMDGYFAYMNIAFEKEAYANEKNLHYLKNRKLFAWFK